MPPLDQMLATTPTYLAEGIGSILLAECFLRQKKSCRHLRILWTAVYCAITITLFALYDNTAPYASLFWIIARVFPIVIMQEVFFRRDIKKQVFLLLSFLSGVYLLRYVDTAAYVVVMNVIVGVMNFLSGQVASDTSATVWLLLYDVVALTFNILTGILYAVLLLTYLHLLQKSFAQKDIPLSNRSFLLLILPSVSAICISFLIRAMLLAHPELPSILFSAPVTRVLLPIGSLLLLALNVATIALLQGELAAQEESKERTLLAHEIRQMHAEVSRVQASQEDLRGLKHDLKNHIEVLRALTAKADDSDAGRLQEYLQRLEDTVLHTELRFQTGEMITDIVLTARATEMERQGVRLEASFLFPKSIGIDPYDIGVILNNALENAMEACQSGDLVTLTAYLKGELFFIETENPYHGTMLQDRESGRLLSTKIYDTDGVKEAHGLGLRNIERCAKRYNGTLDVDVSEGVFRLIVMLAGCSHPKPVRSRQSG